MINIVIEKRNFVIMKAERFTNEICYIGPQDIQKLTKILLAENKARTDTVLAKCQE